MSRRVFIGPDGVSPFRVAVAGDDAETADTYDLLFDGNKPPLRKMMQSAVTIYFIKPGNVAPAIVTSTPLAQPSPSGRFCHFICAGRDLNNYGAGVSNTASTPYRSVNTSTLFGSGWGGAITETDFYGVSFMDDVNGNLLANAEMHFIVFKNYD